MIMKKGDLVLFPTTLFFLVSPYIFGAPFVLVFLIPLIYTFYSDNNSRILYYPTVSLLAGLIALFPLVFYKWHIYLFGAFTAALSLSSFSLFSRYLIHNFKNTRIGIFVPAFSWLGLSMLTPAFDIGVMLPMSCPLIWFTGSIGITSLILIFNGSVAYFLAKKSKPALILSIFIISIFGFCFIYSNLKNPKDFSPDKQPINLALIQGNFNEPEVWLQNNASAVLKRYKFLTEWAVASKPDMIIWPEYPSKTPLIIGANIYADYKPWQYGPALIFDKNGRLIQHHGKLGIIAGWQEFNSNVVRRYRKIYAQYFICLSSDRGLSQMWLSRLASYYSRARAAENKRFLARAANTGITQVISPTGKVISKIPAGKMGFLCDTIYSISEQTFYAKYGDILTKIGLLFIIMSMILIKLTPYFPKS